MSVDNLSDKDNKCQCALGLWFRIMKIYIHKAFYLSLETNDLSWFIVRN